MCASTTSWCSTLARARRSRVRAVRSGSSAPEITLFHQVLGYLQAKPDPPKRPSRSMVGREGVAAAALILRWGSYLAVLLDHYKPVWPEVGSASTSRISDEEMARINLEASAALTQGDGSTSSS